MGLVPTYHLPCAACGREFTAKRASSQAPPQFCSRACWSSTITKRAGKTHTCEQCGQEFPDKPGRAGRFCSLECYWKAGGPAANIPNVQRARTGVEAPGRKRKYLGRVDGKPQYMQRSHWFWNQAHPDDPVQPGEHVHHIDHDVTNDDPSNLAKYTADEHAALHAAEGSLAGPPSVLSRRMTAYHKANPGRQRRGEPKTCPICGVEFYRPPSAKAQTCSAKCQGRLRSLRAKGAVPSPT